MPTEPGQYAEYERLLEAVKFYADNANWQSRVVRSAFDSEGNIIGQECVTGPAWDAGKRARQALGLEGSGRRTTCQQCGGPYNEDTDSWGCCPACWATEGSHE